ncbi:MAG: ABC transporter permease [Pseudomonadota bacterium]
MRKLLRNPSLLIGGTIVVVIVLLAIAAPWVTTYQLEEMDMRNRFSLPSAEHWLGTDNFGRDLWTRLLYGARISIGVAVVSVGLAAIIGTVVGLASGYFGGLFDLIVSRIVDVFLGFPPLIMALTVVAALGPGVTNLMVALTAVFWTEYARVVRAITLSQREIDYVAAAQAVGASWARILVVHILPNCLGPITVLATLGIGTAIVAESGLSFLGIGVEPPTPTWGWTLSYGMRFLRADPWMSTIAGLCIMLTVLGFNLFGDGLRDLLDPRRVTSGRRGRRTAIAD